MENFSKRILACLMAALMLITAFPVMGFAADSCTHAYEAQGTVNVTLSGGKYVVGNETYKCAICDNTKSKQVYLSDDFNKFADSAKEIVTSGKYKPDASAFAAVNSAYSALIALTNGTHYENFVEKRIKAVEEAVTAFNKTKDNSENINSFTVTFVYYVKAKEEVTVKKTVSYGNSAVAPTLSSNFYWDEGRHYEFTGTWNKEFDNVTGDITVTAEYKSGNTHDFIDKTGKIDSTCENEGHEKIEVCRVCGFEKGGEVIAKKEHTWGEWKDDVNSVLDIFVPSTHTKTCTGCYERYKECKKEDHKTEHFEGLAPTCLTDGYKPYDKCKNCDYTNKEIIPAIGHHTEVVDPAVAATCETEGKGEGSHCSVCNTVITAQKTVAKLGHDFSKEVKTDDYKKSSATCTAPDVYYKSCSRCGKATADETFNGEELGHKFTKKIEGENTKVSDANCTEPAVYKYSCAVCGTVGEETYTVGSALGHSWGSYTNNTDGKTKTRVCSRGCTETTCIGNHNYEIIPEKLATCTADGNAAYRRCTVCKTEDEYTVYPKGHKYGAKETAETELATCLVSGTAEEVYYCVREDCPDKDKAIKVTSNVVVPARNHNYGEFVDDQNAKTHTKVCLNENCLPSTEGHSITESHDIEKVEAEDVTCITDGVKAGEKCKVCSYNTSEVIKANGAHTEEIIPAVAATCTATGLTEGKKCSVCGEILVAQTEVPMTPHTEVEIPAVEATCTEKGKTAGKKCSVCETVLEEPQETEALGHDIVTDVDALPATCLVDGRTKGEHCTRCDYKVESEVIKAAGQHTEEEVPATLPTCTESGTTAGKKCSVCGEVLVAYEVLPALGHAFDVVTTKATTAKDGSIVKTCSVCGAAETTGISKIATVVLTKTALINNGKAQTPTVVVKDAKNATLVKGVDYEITYANNNKVGKASATVKFIGDNYSGSKVLYFTIAPVATAKIAVKQTSTAINVSWSAVTGATGYRVQLYNGTKLVKTVTVTGRKANFKKLSKGTKYKVVVTPYVTIDGKNVFGTAKTLTTATKCAMPTNVKVTAGNKKATVKWKKVAGTTGYTVYYSLKKNGTYKSVTVNAKKNSLKLKKLKSGKTYYIKVTANKRLGKTVIRSLPSKLQTVKVK